MYMYTGEPLATAPRKRTVIIIIIIIIIAIIRTHVCIPGLNSLQTAADPLLRLAVTRAATPP